MKAHAATLRPRASVVLLLFLPGLVGGLVPGQVAADDFADPDDLPQAPPAERVNAAIDAGVAFLIRTQQRDGSWGPCQSSGISYDGSVTDPRCNRSGPTSFVLFALASCGVPRKHVAIRKGLRWLHRYERGLDYVSYESCSIILALTALYDEGVPIPPAKSTHHKPAGSPFAARDWKLLRTCVEHLVGPMGCRRSTGGWGYRHYPDEYEDPSITQFALLALRAAARAGYPVLQEEALTWYRALAYLRRIQHTNGGFSYEREGEWSAGMTAAGLASLLICREQELQRVQKLPEWLHGAIEQALQALAEQFAPTSNVAASDRGSLYHYCYLYAVERVGSISRKHLLGQKNWYDLGARYLLAQQRDDGAWDDATCMGPSDVLGTCFALLFLKRATPPAVVTPARD